MKLTLPAMSKSHYSPSGIYRCVQFLRTDVFLTDGHFFPDGMLLPVNRRQRVYPNGTLIIQDVGHESDRGKYLCTARAKTDPGVTRDVDVMVLGK